MMPTKTHMYKLRTVRFLARIDEARCKRNGNQANSSARAAATATVSWPVMTPTVISSDRLLLHKKKGQSEIRQSNTL